MSTLSREDESVRWRLEHIRKVLFETLDADRTDVGKSACVSLAEQVAVANLAARKGAGYGQSKLLATLRKQPNSDAVVTDYLLSARPVYGGIPRKAPKVALCISGQMRGFSLTWPGIKREFVDTYNPDIFCLLYTSPSPRD